MATFQSAWPKRRFKSCSIYLDALQDASIDLYLMTPGGDMKAAIAIENAMGLMHSRVNTYALWECNSFGALLLAGGTGQRVAFRRAMIVVHGLKVRGGPPKEYLDGIQAYYTAFWRERAKLPAQWLPIPLNALHCLTAEQALEYGLIDTVIERQSTVSERVVHRAGCNRRAQIQIGPQLRQALAADRRALCTLNALSESQYEIPVW